MKDNKKQIIDLLNSNKFIEAENLLKNLLNLYKDNIDYCFFYGLVLAQKKNYAEAIIFFKKAQSAETYLYDSIFNIANCYQALNDTEKAFEFYELCSIKFPDRYEPYQKISNYYRFKREYEKAILFINKSIEIKETDYSYYLLGNILRDLGNFDLAKENFENSLKINNNFYYSKLCISKIYSDLGQFKIALDVLINLLNQNEVPHTIIIDAKIDIGNIYKSQGDYSKAIDTYKDVLKLDNNNPHASYGMALCYLHLKDYTMGWRYHEARLHLSTFGVLRERLKKFSKPLWDNNKPKTKLLIWCEQGIGESILYSQFTNILVQEFEDVTLAIDQKLIPFFKKIYPSTNIINIDEVFNFTNYNYHLPMGSIGLYFQNKFDNQSLEKRISYEVHDNSILGKQKKIRCGISWSSGNKIFGHKKSINLNLFKDIFLYKEIEFINIQFSYNKKEVSNIEKDIGNKVFIDHSIDCYNDIDGVASLINGCDFIISVSNSNAHIAGKLGVKTFLLLPHSDGKLWYWGENNDKKILWYPNVYPIRQKKNGEWSDCISDLKKEIEKLL